MRVVVFNNMDDVSTTTTPSTAATPTTTATANAAAPASATKSPTSAKKGSTTLSVDRAAFLLLRVKKAFKKKRQQRKEKQAQLASAAAAAGAQKLNCRRGPPPLLRSRTLPAIVVPGIPVASLHSDKHALRYEHCVSGKLGANGQRWSSLLMRHATPQTNNNNYISGDSSTTLGWKSLHLPQDDTNLVYRRKSSGSTPHEQYATQTNAQQQLQQQQQQQQQQLQDQQYQYVQSQPQQPVTDALDDLECHADGSLLLRIPAPHVVAARAYRLAANRRATKATANTGNPVPAGSDTANAAHSSAQSNIEGNNSSSGSSSSSSTTALTRLAKLLHQSSSAKSASTPMSKVERQFATIPLPTAAGFDNIDEAPRRLSWERRKDSSALQRSGSIDSFAEIVWSVTPRPSLDIPRTVAPFSKRPSASSLYSNCSSTSQNAQLNINYGSDLNNMAAAGGSGGSTASSRRESLLSPSSTRRNKLSRVINALFSAIEHGHLDKARTILESTDVDVNSINTDGLSTLDVAVLSNNRSMTRMLLQHGALEGTKFSNETIGTKLNNLLKDAETRIHDLSDCLEAPYQAPLSARSSISSIIIGNTGSSVTGCAGNEIDKQIGIWERRVKGLRRMLLGWDQALTPDAPSSVCVDVTSENTISVQILEPFEGAIGTKFKVQWSTRSDFNNVVGELEIFEWSSFHGNMGTMCYIGNLTQGRRYFIRAACGNVKGWGPYKNSIPSNVIPSSWKDLNNREDRYAGRQRVLDNLFTAVRLARPADVSELTLNSGSVQKRNPKKKTTIKQLFSVASKFQKHLRRGIYLASIIYCEDKVLVTSEDFLPVIEIDENYPSTLHSDYHWLMKVAFTWDSVKSLRTDMERNLTSTVHFRTKLLAAVCQMQSALGLTDLGQLYYKPLRDAHGTVVLSCIQSVKSQKTISILNSRWLPVNKLQKKIFALLEDYNINEMLIASVSDQMQYHQASMLRLSPGLYMGYLKMQCSVEQIQVVVPVQTPNVLPHCKVRENAHITAEEWQVLKRENLAEANAPVRRQHSPRRLSFDLDSATEETSEVQRFFLSDLTTAAHKLLSCMNVKPEEATTHRLYDVEVIEHSKDISFLIICPAVELTCAAPGQAELLLQRDDLISLSIQSFEMIHLRTYQPGIIQKYARLSCILELDTALANHSQREAFSSSELQLAKERLGKLQELSSSLNAVWKSVRWLMDVIAFARDKNASRSLAMKEILEFTPPNAALAAANWTASCQQQLLQLPIRDVKFNKSGSGRGSWPGPQTATSINLEVEHSRSEQNLGRSASSITTVTATTASTSNNSNNKKQTVTKDSNQHLNVADYDGLNSRKNSGDSITSQYTTHSYYSAMDSGNELDFNIPASRSDDSLALAALDASKQQSTLTQRKRTTSNLIGAAATPPLITVHSSSSAPYLAHDILTSGSSLSLKNSSSSNQNETQKNAAKVKAASSINLRDGGLYLKTTLSALQTEIKTDAAATTTKANKNEIRRKSSEDDNASSSSNLTATETQITATSGIIQVYTAYNTGLATGTSLKLHVTPKTTAREVINLVVKQLNMAAVLKGNNGPIYTPDMLDSFCLVAVIGARERCLRDDFKPLQLQNPWKKGRLYVRQKHELLAAIDHSNRKSHLI